jgi:uncharacterized membrane protein YkvA (DUF1232 family)
LGTIAWLAIGLGTTLAVWALLVLGLIVIGRKEHAREVASFVPDCVVLFRRLLVDPRVPRRAKLALGLLLVYLAMPFDLVPDFIPVAGQLDDAILVAATLAYLVRRSGRAVVEELWPGSERGLRLILAFAPSD